MSVLPRVVLVLGVGVVAAAGLGVGWLGWRVLGVVAFVGQALVTLWLGGRRRLPCPGDGGGTGAGPVGDAVGRRRRRDRGHRSRPWRAAVPSPTDDAALRREPPVLVAVTPQGVVAFWGGHWRLLSPDDGSELARQPAAGDDHEEARVVSVTDGERIYSYAPVSPEEGRLGRRLDDLSLAGTTESPPPGAADDQEVLLAPGRIVVYDGLDDARPGHLVGLGDGPPLDAP